MNNYYLQSVEAETVDFEITFGMAGSRQIRRSSSFSLLVMKFVALVSGGKDSCFNISYCQQNGHELVAAASLRPQDGIGVFATKFFRRRC